MKMKQFLFALLGICLVVSSCVKDKTVTPVYLNNEDMLKKTLSTTEYNVSTKAGYVTEVVLNGQVIATAVSPMTILLPRSYSSTKSDDVIKEVYTPIDEYPNREVTNSSKLYQVICFEDSKSGDYDYNDLVIHVCYKIVGSKFGFGVQPIALGSTKEIKLGYELYKGNTLIKQSYLHGDSENCRGKYFQDTEGMLNTGYKDFYPDNKSVHGWHEYLGSTIKWWDISTIEIPGAFRVEWFIMVADNLKFYALSVDHINQSFDKNGLPYGLVFTETGYTYHQEGKGEVGKDWFNYPMEQTHFKDVYPEIWNWLTTDTSYKDFSEIYSKEARPGAYAASDKELYVVKSDPSFNNNAHKQN